MYSYYSKAINTILAALQSFMASGRAQADFQPMPLPQLRLTVEDQCRLRDRSTIMARQMYASQGSQYADAQVHVISRDLSLMHNYMLSHVINEMMHTFKLPHVIIR